MIVRSLRARPDRPAELLDTPTADVAEGWKWVDVELLEDTPRSELDVLVEGLELDPLAVDDAFADYDLPKVDDFEDHLLIVHHGLSDSKVGTYELDCFLTDTTLITVHREKSPAIDAFIEQVQRSAELASGGPSDVLARIGDVMTRRFLVLLSHLERRLDLLTELALDAHPHFLESLTALRREMALVRGVLRPQREVFDQLRSSSSPLIAEGARRRFSDVYDIAERAVHEFDNARVMMSDALGAYQGAEAREATAITKVLTIYAAIMLPLSLIAGFFGMNFVNLPGADDDSGWVWALAFMSAVAVASLLVFVVAGWLRPASARAATRLLGKTMLDAAKTPVQVAGGLYRSSVKPLKRVAAGRYLRNDE